VYNVISITSVSVYILLLVMYLIKIINNNNILLSYSLYYVTIEIFSNKTIKVPASQFNYVLTINSIQQSNFFEQIKVQEHLGHLQLIIMLTQYLQ